MFRVQPTKGVFLLVTLAGFGVNAFAQQRTADHEPVVAASQTQSGQIATTQATLGDQAVVATVPATTTSAGRKETECVGPASFCNIYFGS